MGVTGLLPFVKKASKHSHIRNFKGCTVAVDAYVWLYKGAFGCAVKLGQGEPTTAYVTYCMKYVNVLLSHGLKPILVLDGRSLPAKAQTNEKRRENRIKNRAKAKEALRRGSKKEAWEYFTKSIEVTPAMARELIKVLRQEKIDYIIAPYEADAQLTYLVKSGIADLVITEDSDLIVFGCPKIFFKLSLSGDGILFDHSKLIKCVDQPAEQFSFERFRQLCILSGCDYLESLPGIGLVRAKKVFSTSINPDIKRVLKQIPMILKLDLKVSEDYIKQFIQAEQTFLYQIVFDPRTRSLLPLTPYPANMDTSLLHFAGSFEDEKVAVDLCLGIVDLKTLEPVPDFSFEPHEVYPETSIWSRDFKIVKKVNPLTEMKTKTKHTSTVGKKASVSLAISGIAKFVKTRSTRLGVKVEEVTEVTTELKDEQILSLYSNGHGNSNHSNGVKVKTEIKTEQKELVNEIPPDECFNTEYSSRTTRRCNINVYKVEKNSSTEIDEEDLENSCNEREIGSSESEKESEEEEEEEEEEDDEEYPIPKKIRKLSESNEPNPTTNKRNLRSRATNPFVKKSDTPKKVPYIFSKLHESLESVKTEVKNENILNPVCLVGKNLIYNPTGQRVIVKSQYFRTEESTFHRTTRRTAAAICQQK